MQMGKILQILILGLLILSHQIYAHSILGSSISQSESICNISWQNLQNVLKIPRITSEDYKYDIRKDICMEASFACCTKNVEKSLVDLAKEQHYDVLLRKNIALLKSNFISYASKLDPIIKNVLKKSQDDFEKLFNKAYSNQYLKYPDMFTQFFDDLHKYYREYPIDINKIIKEFFSKITMVMFEFLTEKDPKSKVYISGITHECIRDQFDDIQPFGLEISADIEHLLIKSIESVKLFTTGLTTTRDMIIELYSQLENPSEKCIRMLTKITQCPMCMPTNNTVSNLDMHQIKPCIHSCMHVYTKCIGVDLNNLNPIWNSYLDLMKKFSWHIEYSINFENTINQLKYQISDAIMFLKANSDNIIQKAALKCSLPATNYSQINNEVKNKRSLSSFDSRRFKRNAKTHAQLHLFFIDLNRYLYNLNGYWQNLVPNVCKIVSAHHEKCWNGTFLTIQTSNEIDEASFANDPSRLAAISNLSYKNLRFNRTFQLQIATLRAFNDQIRNKLAINRFDEIFNPKPIVKNLLSQSNFIDKKNIFTTIKTTKPSNLSVFSQDLSTKTTILTKTEDDEGDYEYQDYYDKKNGKKQYNYDDYSYELDVETSTIVSSFVFYNNTTADAKVTDEKFDFYDETNLDDSSYNYYYDEEQKDETLLKNVLIMTSSTKKKQVVPKLEVSSFLDDSSLIKLRDFFRSYYEDIQNNGHLIRSNQFNCYFFCCLITIFKYFLEFLYIL